MPALVGNFLAGLHRKRQSVSGMSGNHRIFGSLFEDYFRVADHSPGIVEKRGQASLSGLRSRWGLLQTANCSMSQRIQENGRPRAAISVSVPFCYGVSLLIRVDQLASAARAPGPWLAPPHVPSKLSPVPPEKNGPPQLA